ncbi:MAG: alcohol dehydrogenase catalytic domain-containing protein [Bryobacteraceae bacterium]
MRAFRLVEPGKTALSEAPRPKVGPNDVLVRVAATSVCHSDLHIIEAPAEVGYPVPMTLGHEIAGWIEEAGSAVDNFKAGEASFRPRSCIGRRCTRGRYQHRSNCHASSKETPSNLKEKRSRS